MVAVVPRWGPHSGVESSAIGSASKIVARRDVESIRRLVEQSDQNDKMVSCDPMLPAVLSHPQPGSSADRAAALPGQDGPNHSDRMLLSSQTAIGRVGMKTDEHCRHSRCAISMMPVLPNCIVHRPVLSASAALVFLVTAITSSAQLALNTAANPTLSVTAIVFAAIASLALAYCLVSLATLATAVEQLRVHIHSMLMGMACVHADQLEHAIRELDALEALARHCGDDSEALSRLQPPSRQEKRS